MFIAKKMGDEFKEMYHKDCVNDVNLKLAFKNGLTSMSSDSCDVVLEHADPQQYPITLVLFYDSQIYLEKIMQSLALKILDVFIYKFSDQL